MNLESDNITLSENESNAAFMGIRHVDILKIKGLEFHHLFLVILMREPSKLEDQFSDRLQLFYDLETRNCNENEVVYYSSPKDIRNEVIWETTISASSECGYDPNAKKMGNLIKVPNFDRVSEQPLGRRIYSKKIISENLKVINQIFEFEKLYSNSLIYSLIPEASSGFNSNSYFRGVLEYIGLADKLVVPSCFKAPGLSKAVIPLPE